MKKSIKKLQDDKKTQTLNDKQLSQVCGGDYHVTGSTEILHNGNSNPK